MARLVSYSKKDRLAELHVQVTSISGRDNDGSLWQRDQAVAIAEIQSGQETYYVSLNGGRPNLIVSDYEGDKFLKTVYDLDGPTSLLALPDSPEHVAESTQ